MSRLWRKSVNSLEKKMSFSQWSKRIKEAIPGKHQVKLSYKNPYNILTFGVELTVFRQYETPRCSTCCDLDDERKSFQNTRQIAEWRRKKEKHLEVPLIDRSAYYMRRRRSEEVNF